MKITVTFDIPDDVPVMSHHVHYLLNDALGEFCDKREDAWEYVKWRYPHGYLGDHANDYRKIAEVKNRKLLARALRNNDVTVIHLEDEDEHNDRERDRIHCDEPSA